MKEIKSIFLPTKNAFIYIFYRIFPVVFPFYFFPGRLRLSAEKRFAFAFFFVHGIKL